MLFWWICGGESVLPVLLLRHLGSCVPPLIFDPSLPRCSPVTGLCRHQLLEGWSPSLFYFSTMNVGSGWLHKDNFDFSFKGSCVNFAFYSIWIPALSSQLWLSYFSGPLFMYFATCRLSFLPSAHSVALQSDVWGSRCLAENLPDTVCLDSVGLNWSLRSVTDSTENSKARSAFTANVPPDANLSNSLRHDIFCQLLLWWFCKDFMEFCQFWKFAFFLLAAFIFNDLNACL